MKPERWRWSCSSWTGSGTCQHCEAYLWLERQNCVCSSSLYGYLQARNGDVGRDSSKTPRQDRHYEDFIWCQLLNCIAISPFDYIRFRTGIFSSRRGGRPNTFSWWCSKRNILQLMDCLRKPGLNLFIVPESECHHKVTVRVRGQEGCDVRRKARLIGLR